jgi:hypothetical protein
MHYGFKLVNLRLSLNKLDVHTILINYWIFSGRVIGNGCQSGCIVKKII